jgi:plasmid stabilization system protein ParE
MIIRPAATADIQEAYSWYEARREGLGQEFRDAVDAALLLVAAAPRAFPILHRDTRRVLLKRFPYGLFYRFIGEQQVIVVACMHAKRNPRQWRGRR